MVSWILIIMYCAFCMDEEPSLSSLLGIRYDGDIEEKTDSEIARDLFLYRQDVEPVKDRLKTFTLAVGGIWVASCLALNVVFQAKPMFNEYEPSMLERLSYDEKMADVAQQNSNGRPTYCDSRYYRAVANGGQGEFLFKLLTHSSNVCPTAASVLMQVAE